MQSGSSQQVQGLWGKHTDAWDAIVQLTPNCSMTRKMSYTSSPLVLISLISSQQVITKAPQYSWARSLGYQESIMRFVSPGDLYLFTHVRSVFFVRCRFMNEAMQTVLETCRALGKLQLFHCFSTFDNFLNNHTSFIPSTSTRHFLSEIDFSLQLQGKKKIGMTVAT